MISTEHVAGMTFASSMRGWRYDRLNQYVFFASIAGWIFLSDYFQREDVFWEGTVIMVSVWVIFSWFMRGVDKRRVFGARVEICEDHLDVVDDGVPSSIPWKDIIYIRIDRSPSGHRRNVRIRARGGKLLRLMDPEDGALLESWALEVGRSEGIKVKVRNWVTLNAEPAWTFLMCLLAMAATQFAILRELF